MGVLCAAGCSLPVPSSCTNAPKGQRYSQDFPQSFRQLPSKSQPQIQRLPHSGTRWCQACLQAPFQGTAPPGVPQLLTSTALQYFFLPCKGCKIKLGEGEANHTGSRYRSGGDSFLLANSRHIAYVKCFVNVGQVCAGGLGKRLQMKWPNY